MPPKTKIQSVPLLDAEVLTAEQPLASLSARDRKFLEDREALISRGYKTFIEVGRALSEIREYRGGILYREQFGNFENYCRVRWEMGRAHAYRQIEAARVFDELSPMGDNAGALPQNERQIRPLVALDSDKRQAAWRRAIELAGGAVVSSRHVRSAVREIAPSAGKKAKPVGKRKTPPDVEHIAESLDAIAEALAGEVAATEINRKKLKQIIRQLRGQAAALRGLA